jgi:hypothetical protein
VDAAFGKQASPDHQVGIAEEFDIKMAALRALRPQSKLVPFYTQWAERRGFQEAQAPGRALRRAEAFQRDTTVVDVRLPGPNMQP